MRLQILRLIDHEPKALLNANRQLDEATEIKPERSLDVLGEHGGQGQLRETARLEPEPLDQDVFERLQYLVNLHPISPWPRMAASYPSNGSQMSKKLNHCVGYSRTMVSRAATQVRAAPSSSPRAAVNGSAIFTTYR